MTYRKLRPEVKQTLEKIVYQLELVGKTLQLMELNINHPSLRLHKLSGRLNDLSSVSINVSYRITLELIIQDKDIIMINIGAHDEVYN